MSPERREIAVLVYQAIRNVDRQFASLSDRVTAIVRALPDRVLTRQDRMPLRRQIDRVLDAVFGLVQRSALTSELFLAILRATDAAAEAPFQRMLSTVRSAVERRNPSLWQMMRARLLSGGTGPSDGFARVYAVLTGPQVERQRFLRAGLLDANRAWINGSRYRLSDRVWKTGQDVRRHIDDVLRDGIRRGEGPLTIARELETYLNEPASRYLADGRIVARGQTVQRSRYGSASSAARRLARTEISRVHAIATQRVALVTPGIVGLRYVLSGSHPRPDRCNPLADRDVHGLGTGVYPVRDCPLPPAHPQCLCGVQRVTVPPGTFVDDLIARYGLEDVA